MRKPLLATVCFLLVYGCNNDNSTPPPPPEQQTFTLAISGTLTATTGLVSPNSGTVWFDSKQLASNLCSTPPACHSLDLTATTTSKRGTYFVEFQLVRQSCSALPCTAPQTYQSSGNVNVSNSSGVVQQIPLPQVIQRLSEGDRVSYQITVNPQ